MPPRYLGHQSFPWMMSRAGTRRQLRSAVPHRSFQRTHTTHPEPCLAADQEQKARCVFVGVGTFPQRALMTLLNEAAGFAPDHSRARSPRILHRTPFALTDDVRGVVQDVGRVRVVPCRAYRHHRQSHLPSGGANEHDRHGADRVWLQTPCRVLLRASRAGRRELRGRIPPRVDPPLHATAQGKSRTPRGWKRWRRKIFEQDWTLR